VIEPRVPAAAGQGLIDPEASALVRAFLGRKRSRPPRTAQAQRDPMFKRSGSSFDLKSIREYQGSDDPRRIDWRLAARSGRLYVKEYFEEEREGAVILVDLSASMGVFGAPGGEGDLEARRMGATIAWILGALGLPTSLLAFAAKPLRRLDRPRGGLSRRPIEAFFAALSRDAEGPGSGGGEAAARAIEREGTDIGAALASARAACRYRRLILVSDFFDPAWKPAASPFSRNSFIRLYRPLDTLFQGALELDVRDPESGARLRLPWDRTAEIAYRERERELDGLLGEAERRGAFYATALPGGDRPSLYWDFLEALYA
jgi:uncharacterized protein (DUF58 family)